MTFVVPWKENAWAETTARVLLRRGMTMAEHEEMKAMAEGNPGEAVTPSGPMGDNPATAGTGKRQLCSKTPENADGEINPSAPGQTGTTPHSDR